MKRNFILLIALLVAGVFAALFYFKNSDKTTERFSSQPPNPGMDFSSQANRIPSPQAQKCGQCHQSSFQAWQNSQHAKANQLWQPKQDLQPPGIKTQPVMKIGLTPLIQFLIPKQGGRFQVFDHAWDPHKKEWFYVFEDTGRSEGEWGHWTGRGMNWNSQCAVCHMTQYDKGYDITTDSYHSTWEEMGISCAQCHGGAQEHPKKLSASQIEASCASCHSRREELVGGFQPGDAFFDFFRMMLPDHADLFYPDGQTKEEVFEYNSFQLSAMAHSGVTCLDCHNPHSGKLIQPVKNNALCLSCHQSPGIKGAIPIDPVQHSHHAPESAGNQCINCHMPAKAFMVRDFRRDHGFTIPDPLLTKEWKIPNACNTCHQDRSIDWAIQKTQAWYGKKMDRRSRQRARMIAKAQAGDPKVWSELLKLAQAETIPAWRATLISHLAPWVAEPTVQTFLMDSLKDDSPLVRSAAVRAIKRLPNGVTHLSALKEDPTRLVRLDVAWALAIQTGRPSKYEEELMQYLNFHADQPVGALKQGQLALAQQNFAQATHWLEKAITWDPASAYPQYLMGRVLYLLKRLPEAQGFLEQATQLAPENAEYAYHLALLLAETGQQKPSRVWLEKTVALAPNFGRAWFNLGLAFLQEEQLEKAILALEQAETLLPQSPDPPEVLAELYRRKGQSRKSYEKFQKAQRLRKTKNR